MTNIKAIPTEPIGSIPRSKEVQSAITAYTQGVMAAEELDMIFNDAVKETIRKLEATNSPVISDGEQTKSSFVTYPLEGLDNLSSKGVVIPFEDGHTRQLPCLTKGPFKYAKYAGSFLKRAKKFTSKPMKQAVISASAMSLLYPEEEINNYSKKQFLADLIQESVKDIRSCFDNGAHKVQIDFTEGRLAVKLDPSKKLLQNFIDIINQVLSHFSEEERLRIGVHTCPGGDHDSTHSADVPYSELIPMLMTLNVGNFYMEMAGEKNPEEALKLISENLGVNQRVFIGVINVIDEEIETVELVRDRVLLAAKHIPVEQLGTTDDCGFSPFSDDIATSRNTAFAKIAARVKGTEEAYLELMKNK